MLMITTETDDDLAPNNRDIQVQHLIVNERNSSSLKHFTRKHLTSVVLCLFVFIIGFVVGYLVLKAVYVCSGNGSSGQSSLVDRGYNESLSRLAFSFVDSQRLERLLADLAANPHLAGSRNNSLVADRIVRNLHDSGLPSSSLVKSDSFDVVLPELLDENISPSGFTLLNGNGQQLYKSTQLLNQMNAFSPSGEVTGPAMFANYGREKDFDVLRRIFATDKPCQGNIVLMKYTKLYRASKVNNAMRCGAIGAILYLDPIDFAQNESSLNNHSIPYESRLRPDEVQRGTVKSGFEAVLQMNRSPDDGSFIPPLVGVPSIPVHPVSYEDASVVLKKLKPLSAEQLKSLPTDFRSNLTDFGNIGPGLKDGQRLKLRVNSKLSWANITNIFAQINGSVEPDQLVMVGCHYDAWTYGAADPLSGTAVVLELYRVLNKLYKEHNWRPRRTLVFANWDAEEIGLLGSTKWVNANLNRLQKNLVAYVNLDGAVRGNWILYARSDGLLSELIHDAAKIAPAVSFPTIYQEWLNRSYSADHKERAPIYPLGGGSDHVPFSAMVGVPVTFIRYWFDFDKYHHTNIPQYHTLYDTAELMTKWIDPGFAYHTALTRLYIDLILRLTDSRLVPFGVVEGAESIGRALNDSLNGRGALSSLAPGLKGELVAAVSRHVEESSRFQKEVVSAASKNTALTRCINSALIQLTRVFVAPVTQRGISRFGNLLNEADGYGNSAFPYLADAVNQLRLNPDDPATKATVLHQTDLLLNAFRAASVVLRQCG